MPDSTANEWTDWLTQPHRSVRVDALVKALATESQRRQTAELLLAKERDANVAQLNQRISHLFATGGFG